jgi:nucleotide-binding universal stress UspA family protein
MIDRILVPLDGSPLAEDALGHAAAVARSLGSELILLRVVDGGGAISDLVPVGAGWRLRRAEAAAYLREVKGRFADEDLEVTVEVAEGRAADELIRQIRTRGVELVVMSTHGLGEAFAFSLGGTTQKVLSLAPCSVMLIRPAMTRRKVTTRVAYRKILVPVDGSPAAEWALCLAASIARGHGAELLMLQLVPDLPAFRERIPHSPEEMELLDRLRVLRQKRGEHYLDEMGSHLARSGLQVSMRVALADDIGPGIQRFAEQEKVDLIVASAHGVAHADVRYGRVAQRLMTECALPLLVLQDLSGDSKATGLAGAVGA